MKYIYIYTIDFIYIYIIICSDHCLLLFLSWVKSNHERHLERCVTVCSTVYIYIYLCIHMLRGLWESPWDTRLDTRRWVYQAEPGNDWPQKQHSIKLSTVAEKYVSIKCLYNYIYIRFFLFFRALEISWDKLAPLKYVFFVKIQCDKKYMPNGCLRIWEHAPLKYAPLKYAPLSNFCRSQNNLAIYHSTRC